MPGMLVEEKLNERLWKVVPTVSSFRTSCINPLTYKDLFFYNKSVTKSYKAYFRSNRLCDESTKSGHGLINKDTWDAADYNSNPSGLRFISNGYELGGLRFISNGYELGGF
jgi:hypothetical protein